MTQDEIKKSLECCILVDGNSCKTCPYLFYENCKSGAVAVQDALNLITEQEKEIERLKAEKKQAKIDVLNELKDKMFEREYMGVKYKERIFYESEIDDMIAEVQNGEDKG